jgi:hypothetical protein
MPKLLDILKHTKKKAVAIPGRIRRGSVEIITNLSGSIRARRNSVAPDTGLHSPQKKPHRDLLWNQKWVRDKYESGPIQIFVAVLIGINFFVSAINAQLLPGEGTAEEDIFKGFEIFFALAFTIELIWNMYGRFWCMFWTGEGSGWNVFDFVIVAISLMSLFLSDLPGISVLRLFRAFRVFRLFKRIPSLRMIIEGILASLPGVLNAFLVLGILMGIWSIMGVEFFREAQGEMGGGQAVGPECFGTFLKAMFTM